MKSKSIIAWLLAIQASLALAATTMPSGGVTSVGATSVGATPVGATPVGATPVGATPVDKAPPSEDPVLRNFHTMGLVDGHDDIFRCASPLHESDKSSSTTTRPVDAQVALGRMQRVYGLGIRTIICLENDRWDNDDGTTDSAKTAATKQRVAMEQTVAAKTGLRLVMMPMTNRGAHSLQDMSDAQVLDWLTRVSDEILRDARSGGVMFHCAGGRDRTGIVAAFIRIKYQGWPVDRAIAEMRADGHEWKKFSSDGGVSSWHEDHLRTIAKMLAAGPATRP